MKNIVRLIQKILSWRNLLRREPTRISAEGFRFKAVLEIMSVRELVSAWVRIGLFSLLVGASGCVYSRAVSLTNIPSDRKNPVNASVKRYFFLMINQSNDYVFDLKRSLKSQCQNASVQGLLTKDMDIWYFYPILTAREVEVSGFCTEKRLKSETASLHEEVGVESIPASFETRSKADEERTEFIDQKLLEETVSYDDFKSSL